MESGKFPCRNNEGTTRGLEIMSTDTSLALSPLEHDVQYLRFVRPKCLLVYSISPDGDALSFSRGKHSLATELIMDGPYSSHLSTTTKCAVVAHGDAFCRPRFVEHRTLDDMATSLPHCHMYDVTPVPPSYQAHTGDEYCTLGPSYQFSYLSALAGFVLLYITEHHHPPEALQKAFFRLLGSSCVSHDCLMVLCLHGHIYYTRDSPAQ